MALEDRRSRLWYVITVKKTIDDDSKFCRYCGNRAYQEKTGAIRINSVSDYLKLVGIKVTVSLKSRNETVTGTVKDLSDDGKYLILMNPENRFKKIHHSERLKNYFLMVSRKKIGF